MRTLSIDQAAVIGLSLVQQQLRIEGRNRWPTEAEEVGSSQVLGSLGTYGSISVTYFLEGWQLLLGLQACPI